MVGKRRSGCPISFGLDLFGDKWSLLILRDLAFGGTKHYRQLVESAEGIATNVLAERLRRLVKAGLIVRDRDPKDRKRTLYSLTPKGLDTLPILVEMILWGATHDPRSAAPKDFMDRLRKDPVAVMAELHARARNGVKRPVER